MSFLKPIVYVFKIGRFTTTANRIRSVDAVVYRPISLTTSQQHDITDKHFKLNQPKLPEGHNASTSLQILLCDEPGNVYCFDVFISENWLINIVYIVTSFQSPA